MAVTGTVTLNGQPAAQADVYFKPDPGTNGRTVSGATNENGQFKLYTAKLDDGAAPCEYTVTLSEYYPPDKPPKPPPGGGFLPSRFPTKYADPETSPLTATIERGQKNDFQFEVK